MGKRINSISSDVSKRVSFSRSKRQRPSHKRGPEGCASLPWSTEDMIKEYLSNRQRREEYKGRHLRHHSLYTRSQDPWPPTRYQEDFQRHPTDLVMEAYHANRAALSRNRRRDREDNVDFLPPRGWYPAASTPKGRSRASEERGRRRLSAEEIVLTIDDLLELLEEHQSH